MIINTQVAIASPDVCCDREKGIGAVGMQQSRAIRVETKQKSRIKYNDKARNGKCRLRTTNIKLALEYSVIERRINETTDSSAIN